MPVRYITVNPVTQMFKPVERSFGDVAIVGATDGDAAGPIMTPIPVTNPNSVSHASNSAGKDLAIDNAAWFKGALGESVRLAFEQTPGPAKVWAVRTNASADDPVEDALGEVAKLNVQIVALAATPLAAPDGSGEQAGKEDIELLASHVSTVSTSGGDGKERIGVAMLSNEVSDPTVISSSMSIDRMVMVAHKSTTGDAAAAVAGTIAGYEPHISLLLKPVKLDMPSQFSDSEIDAFNTARLNWLTDPVLMPGKGLYMGEAYTLGNEMPYIDIVRTIDDISFRLKARLIRTIGNLRISRSGLRSLVSQMTAILEPLKNRGVIEHYDVFIPVLALLDRDPSSLSEAEDQQIQNAQNDRTVDAFIEVDYAGAIHRLNITLLFK